MMKNKVNKSPDLFSKLSEKDLTILIAGFQRILDQSTCDTSDEEELKDE